MTPPGVDVPAPLAVRGIRLAAGETYGFYISVSDYATSKITLNYTDGSGAYQDDNLKIVCGVGFGAPDFSGLSINQNRIWNGTIYYRVLPAAVPNMGDASGRMLWAFVTLAFLSVGALLALKTRRFGRGL
jgi:hypothetical protein